MLQAKKNAGMPRAVYPTLYSFARGEGRFYDLLLREGTRHDRIFEREK